MHGVPWILDYPHIKSPVFLHCFSADIACMFALRHFLSQNWKKEKKYVKMCKYKKYCKGPLFGVLVKKTWNMYHKMWYKQNMYHMYHMCGTVVVQKLVAHILH